METAYEHHEYSIYFLQRQISEAKHQIYNMNEGAINGIEFTREHKAYCGLKWTETIHTQALGVFFHPQIKSNDRKLKKAFRNG